VQFERGHELISEQPFFENFEVSEHFFPHLHLDEMQQDYKQGLRQIALVLLLLALAFPTIFQLQQISVVPFH
jgi:hypothetical protein